MAGLFWFIAWVISQTGIASAPKIIDAGCGNYTFWQRLISACH